MYRIDVLKIASLYVILVHIKDPHLSFPAQSLSTMSANSIYRSYKALSTDLFVPIDYNPGHSAEHYDRLARRYKRCARLRQKFQKTYVLEDERDEGHQKAIEAALRRSNEARYIHYSNFVSTPTVKLCNRYVPIAPIDAVESVTTEEATGKHVSVIAKPNPVVIDNDLQFLQSESRKILDEKVVIVVVIFDIIQKFWMKHPQLGNRNITIISLITWGPCNVVPLRAKDFAHALKSTGLVDRILHAYDHFDKEDGLEDVLLTEFLHVYYTALKAIGKPQTFDIDNINCAALGLALVKLRNTINNEIDHKSEKRLRKICRQKFVK